MRFISTALLPFLLVIPAYCQEIQSFTLQDCLYYGLSNSKLLVKDSLERSMAAAEIEMQKAKYLPQIDAFAAYRQNFDVQTYLFPEEEGLVFNPNADNPVPVRLGGNANLNIGLNLTQTLFEHEWTYAKEYQTLAENILELKRELTEIVLLSKIATTYYEVLTLSSKNQLLDFNLNRLDKMEELVKEQVNEQIAKQSDLKKVSLEKSALSIEKEQLAMGIEAKKKLLKLLMGMPLREDIYLTGMPIRQGISLEDSLYIEKSPTYKIAENQKELNRYELRKIKSDFLPKAELEANFQYQYMNESFDALNADFWFPFNYIGVELAVPVFQGGLKKNLLQKSRTAYEIHSIEDDQERKQKEIELESSKAQYDINVRFTRNKELKRNLAREIFENKQIMFEEKQIPLTDLLETEGEYRQAEIDYIEAVYAVKISEIKILELLGETKLLLSP